MDVNDGRWVIAGAGPFGREILRYALDLPAPVCPGVAGFVDDGLPAGAEVAGLPVLGPVGSQPAGVPHVVAIGDPEVRDRVARTLEAAGATFPVLVHPTAYLGAGARLGAGVVVCPFAFVGIDVRLDDHAVLNIAARLPHDGHVGRCAQLGPGVTAAGCVTVGDLAFVGTNATLGPGITVGRGARVTVGAVVVRDVPSGAVAAGNPARLVPKLT